MNRIVTTSNLKSNVTKHSKLYNYIYYIRELRELEDETVESQLSLQETCRNIHEIEATIKHLINMEENLKVTIHEQEKEIESLKNIELV